MTVLYAYKLENTGLIEKLQLPDMYHVNHLDSLDNIPQQLERPSVIFFNGNEPALQNMINRSKQQQSALTPIVLTENEAQGMRDPMMNRWCDYLNPSSPDYIIYNRLERALAFSQYQLQTNQSSQYEPVTGLYSYSYFTNRLKEEMAGARRHDSALSCVVLKFSFYEAYLDSYGYDFIEKLYEKLGDTVKNAVRQEDIVARLGDDEIGMLLPQTDEEGARILANRMLEKAMAVHFNHNGNTNTEEITVHAGIASYPNDEMNELEPDNLLRYARHALHHARMVDEQPSATFAEVKRHGMNAF